MDDRNPSLANTGRLLSDKWMPLPCLTVGVTGHRLERMGVDNVPAVQDAIAKTLRAVAKATAALVHPPALRLITALAEGADSIAADEALALGWTLDSVLPLDREDYANDFPDDAARVAHSRRLEASRAVFELPGERSESGAAIAYERAGRIVLGQCDLLLAVWDHGPLHGRGGTAQIVAEAVLQGIPVIHINPHSQEAPIMLWDRLQQHDLGQQSVDTVARGGLDRLPIVVTALLEPPMGDNDRAMLRHFETEQTQRRTLAFAFPILLLVMGVRRLSRRDFRVPDPVVAEAAIAVACAPIAQYATEFGKRLHRFLVPRFAKADVAATYVAQLFRSGYVTNFALSALAVLLALLGLALPSSAKPVLILLELSTIAAILILTRAGNRVAWHTRWLDNRQLAERLRCLAMAAQVGDLDLRIGDNDETEPRWVRWYARATARELGLPSARVDAFYLSAVQDGLCALMDEQIAYLKTDARRMHRLEHRLHLLGTILFGMTAVICISFLLFEIFHSLGVMGAMAELSKPVAVGVTIASAVLPAVGAAIYGIRMQGDFAGIAERSETLSHQLGTLRHVISNDDLNFDTLRLRIRRAADLMTADLANWRQTYHARPLSLPG